MEEEEMSGAYVVYAGGKPVGLVHWGKGGPGSLSSAGEAAKLAYSHMAKGKSLSVRAADKASDDAYFAALVATNQNARRRYGHMGGKPYRNPSKEVKRKSDLKPDKRYTLWLQSLWSGHYSVERSYPGPYVRDVLWADVKEYNKGSGMRKMAVFPEGVDPNAGGTPPRRRNTHLAQGQMAKWSASYLKEAKRKEMRRLVRLHGKTKARKMLSELRTMAMRVVDVHPKGYTVLGPDGYFFAKDKDLVAAKSDTRQWPGTAYKGKTPGR